MKKIIALLGFILLISVVFVVAESKAEDNNPLLLIYGRLGDILDKITELVNKDWDVTVEPNITVQPPQVNVEVTPNITLPDKECKWEKINGVETKLYKHPGQQGDSEYGTLIIPPNVLYSEVEIISGIISVAEGPQPILFINGDLDSNPCQSNIPINKFTKLSENCISALNEGYNEYRLLWGKFGTIDLNFKIKSANC